MIRHMLTTFAIVFGIYASLLVIIDHPFATWTKGSSAGKVTTQTEMNSAPTESDVIAHNPVKSNKSLFKGPLIFGVTAIVNLSNAEQEVNQVWQQLLNNQVLINNVDWGKGNIMAYAYYSEFDTNMNKARLNLGFDGNDLKLHSDLPNITLPSGQFEQFAMDATTGGASAKAWTKAYEHKNLIERHTLDRNGELVSADALVVLK